MAQVNDPVQAIGAAADQVHAHLADLPLPQAWQVVTGAIEAWNSAGQHLAAARLRIVWGIWQTLPDPTVRALADELGVSVTRAQQLLTAARAQMLWGIWQTLPDPTVDALAEELGVSVTRAQKLLTAARAQREPDTSAPNESHASDGGQARQG